MPHHIFRLDIARVAEGYLFAFTSEPRLRSGEMVRIYETGVSALITWAVEEGASTERALLTNTIDHLKNRLAELPDADSDLSLG
jgi:hypothetical protein